MKKRTTEDWTKALEGICITCPLYTVPEAINDPQIEARGAINELQFDGPGGESKKVLTPNLPVRLSRTAAQVARAPSWVGEDTPGVLEELLSLNAEEVKRLAATGAVRIGGPNAP